MLSPTPFLFALCIPVGFFPSSWPGCFLYLLLLATQDYFESAFEQDATEGELGWQELLELSFVLTLSILFSPIAGLSSCIFFAIKRLLWNEQRIPKRFRLPKDHYSKKQRRFLVTGAASGVGRHMVGVLSRMNHLVLATDINPSQLEAARDEENWNGDLVVLRKLDVTNDSDWTGVVEECVSRWGGLDVLMNIAGFLKPGKVNNLTARDVQLHVDVNMKGVMLGTSHAAKLMTEQVKSGKLDSGGHIINFASLGAIAPVSGVGLYIGTKYGCRGFSLCASKDLFESGVFVTCVMPDAIQTPMVDLQLHYEESAMAYSGKILKLVDVERVLVNRVLPNREREVLIPTSIVRGIGARLADVFSGSLLLNYVELIMRQKGIQTQQTTKRQHAQVIAGQAATRVRKNAISGRSPSPAPNQTHL